MFTEQAIRKKTPETSFRPMLNNTQQCKDIYSNTMTDFKLTKLETTKNEFKIPLKNLKKIYRNVTPKRNLTPNKSRNARYMDIKD